MSDNIDQEIEAIKTLLLVLEPLETGVRASVLEYVLKRLNVKLSEEDLHPPTPEGESTEPPAVSPEFRDRQVTIKTLKEEKAPKSAIEMAVLVAYYLSHSAPESERKSEVKNDDIKKYFIQAGFKLPTKPEFTLGNAKNAGYLEGLGKGEYRLNPVGYNLAVHTMPRKGATTGTTPKRRKPAKRKPAKKKPAKKKSAKKKSVK